MWKIDNQEISSRLMLGTAGYPTLENLIQSIERSKTQIVTVSLRRSRLDKKGNSTFLTEIEKTGVNFLPNTSGCFNLQDIITVSEMARELLQTNWIKLETVGDDYTLLPDPVLLIEATGELVKRGFEVFPYTTPDIVICQRLADAGCNVLMPLAAPIGSGQGPIYMQDLERLRHKFPKHHLIVDAGIGKPSHAAAVMEMGYDGVLLNTAVSKSGNPPVMAQSFATAIEAGRSAYLAGMIAESPHAKASSPLIDRPFWHQEKEGGKDDVAA